MPVDSALDLDADGWRMGETTFQDLIENLSELRPESILEFGGGASSVRLAKEFPDCSIFSIDHDAEYWRQTLELKERFLHSPSLEIGLRPLKWQRHGLGFYKSYTTGPLPDYVDAIVIDGPPQYTVRGREACLYQAVKYLRKGGRVYLDDYARASEKQIVANWLSRYPHTFHVQEILSGHHLCVLTKINEARPRASLQVLRDNWTQNLRVCRQSFSAFRRRALSL